MAKQKKLKRYFVEFDFKTTVKGYVEAVDAGSAKRIIVEGSSNPDFNDMTAVWMPSQADIEFETCVEDEL